MGNFLKNNKQLEVLTDTGWSSFDGLSIKAKSRLIELTTKNTSLKCTPDHKIFNEKFKFKAASKFNIGENISGKNGPEQLTSVNQVTPEIVFDLVNVKNNNRFYANDLLVANCQFISFDEVLINPFVLNRLQGVEPAYREGQIRWYKKPQKGKTYIVALDPSIGTGGNPAAIQVLEADTYTQVAEWCHNKTPVEGQVNLLKEITTYISSITEEPTKIYWSVENNTLGEAVLVTIRNVGEENIPGIFLSEPVKVGNVRKFRKGFCTTNSNKLAACAKLKSLIESDKMNIYSKKLISELKNFISVENTYRAKIGETDDLVLALLLAVRMLESIKQYVPELSDAMDISEFNIPLPFMMSTSSNRLY